ncbi:divalent-cation tolerance protein CutA [Candidatus Pantoea edessiphila]|uniref:Divalent-cation tolerance protein CutA n=1 Tax=Candidatus Pantoea edessiphila TaxID=2044610 RepID=A0A2P5SY97_9GAMM|nr:divalent cation tolerance protein CutA [Candidatus Pantoea edessiphila]MBK4775888.1 divalent cation tolerance protein CutA [Pantoea sp. Edef]PPI87308.1 divalent-cation tolerance protein CutA [Candidatus Pantoea edessiphila]
MSIIIIVCTLPQQNSKDIAEKLLQTKLTPCITIIPEVVSYYMWKNKIKRDKEVQLLIKSDNEHQKALVTLLKKIHPYEIPEILSIPVNYADSEYHFWLKESFT